MTKSKDKPKREAKTPPRGKTPAVTGRELAVTRGKGKKKGLKKQGY